MTHGRPTFSVSRQFTFAGRTNKQFTRQEALNQGVF